MSHQLVPFRVIQMPCCNILICWVNPRRPNYCPECGKFIFKSFDKATWETTYSEAWLEVKDDNRANYSPITIDSEEDLSQYMDMNDGK